MPIDPFTPPNGYDLISISHPIKYFDLIDLMDEFKEYPWREIVYQKFSSYIGNNLVLMIQTDTPRDQLKQYFDTVLEIFTRNKSARLKKSEGIDHWKVYEMKKSRLNFAQIVFQIFNKKGDPNTDNEIGALYKKVKRAYKKAHNIIKYIENLEMRE